MDHARHPDVSASQFHRELSLVAGSSVDPEIIIKVHRFELDEGGDPIIDLNGFPAAKTTYGTPPGHRSYMEMSSVLAAMRDINDLLEERSQDS